MQGAKKMMNSVLTTIGSAGLTNEKNNNSSKDDDKDSNLKMGDPKVSI